LLARLFEKAHHQGGLFSQTDLYEILIVDKSTIKRIVKRIKARGDSIPTRGEIKDIGSGIYRKARIIEPLRLDALSLKTSYIPESYSLPITSRILLEADNLKMNATSYYYTHLL